MSLSILQVWKNRAVQVNIDRNIDGFLADLSGIFLSSQGHNMLWHKNLDNVTKWVYSGIRSV
jgi:hypothetical protein